MGRVMLGNSTLLLLLIAVSICIWCDNVKQCVTNTALLSFCAVQRVQFSCPALIFLRKMLLNGQDFSGTAILSDLSLFTSTLLTFVLAC